MKALVRKVSIWQVWADLLQISKAPFHPCLHQIILVFWCVWWVELLHCNFVLCWYGAWHGPKGSLLFTFHVNMSGLQRFSTISSMSAQWQDLSWGQPKNSLLQWITWTFLSNFLNTFGWLVKLTLILDIVDNNLNYSIWFFEKIKPTSRHQTHLSRMKSVWDIAIISSQQPSWTPSWKLLVSCGQSQLDF